MVTGFNSDVEHRGRRYHIQTEDLGTGNQCLLTLVYDAGAILTRIKVPYAEILGPQASREQIHTFMDAHHHRVIGEIRADRLMANAPPARTLEDLIAEARPTPVGSTAGAAPGEANPAAERKAGGAQAGGT